MDLTEFLVVIPARKGSKGIPGKNHKDFNGKPLFQYTLDFALKNFASHQIYVSTNDEIIQELAENCGIDVPILRSDALSTDQTGMQAVLLDVIEKQEAIGKQYQGIILLQPTSPFRRSEDLEAMSLLFDPSVDMVVSVCRSKENPYFNLFELSEKGFLFKSKEGNHSTRQEAPQVFAFNGSMYFIQVKSLKEKSISCFDKIKMFEMTQEFSIDLDEPIDWEFAEFLLKNKKVHVD